MNITLLDCESSVFSQLASRVAAILVCVQRSCCSRGEGFVVSPTMARDGVRVSYVTDEGLELVAQAMAKMGLRPTVDADVRQVRVRA